MCAIFIFEAVKQFYFDNAAYALDQLYVYCMVRFSVSVDLNHVLRVISKRKKKNMTTTTATTTLSNTILFYGPTSIVFDKIC